LFIARLGFKLTMAEMEIAKLKKEIAELKREKENRFNETRIDCLVFYEGLLKEERKANSKLVSKSFKQDKKIENLKAEVEATKLTQLLTLKVLKEKEAEIEELKDS